MMQANLVSKMDSNRKVEYNTIHNVMVLKRFTLDHLILITSTRRGQVTSVLYSLIEKGYVEKTPTDYVLTQDMEMVFDLLEYERSIEKELYPHLYDD